MSCCRGRTSDPAADHARSQTAQSVKEQTSVHQHVPRRPACSRRSCGSVRPVRSARTWTQSSSCTDPSPPSPWKRRETTALSTLKQQITGLHSAFSATRESGAPCSASISCSAIVRRRCASTRSCRNTCSSDEASFLRRSVLSLQT